MTVVATDQSDFKCVTCKHPVANLREIVENHLKGACKKEEETAKGDRNDGRNKKRRHKKDMLKTVFAKNL